MPQEAPDATPEVIPLPDFLRKLSEDLRANAMLDQEVVSILDTHLINVDPNKKSGAAAADAIEKLAIQRAEAEHA